jgi:hypothetical protein
MVQHRKFMDLALDEQGLHTPDGLLALDRITKVDVILNFSRDHRERGSENSGAGILGGALLGGAIAGSFGAIGGGLLGSAASYENGDEDYPRATSAVLIFESPDLAYSTRVSRDRVDEAQAFVAAVQNAAGL